MYLEEKHSYGADTIVNDYPEYGWNVNTIKKLIGRIDKTGSVLRKEGSGRPRSVRTEETIEQVEELILSQEDQPGTHLTPTEISRELGIDRNSVYRIIDQDLELRPLKKQKIHARRDIDMERRVQKCKRAIGLF